MEKGQQQPMQGGMPQSAEQQAQQQRQQEYDSVAMVYIRAHCRVSQLRASPSVNARPSFR